MNTKGVVDEVRTRIAECRRDRAIEPRSIRIGLGVLARLQVEVTQRASWSYITVSVGHAYTPGEQRSLCLIYGLPVVVDEALPPDAISMSSLDVLDEPDVA